LLMRRNAGHRVAVLILDPPPGPVGIPTLPEVKEVTLVEFLTQAAIALAVVLVLAAVLGWLVAGRVLRPIRTISATAHRLSAENLSERVPVTTPPDELATLATTINGMLDRIQQ